MKKIKDARVWLFFQENWASIATLLAGGAAIIGESLGWIQNQAVVNTVIISLLCLFALSEIIQRTGKLERIESAITDLLKSKDGYFIKDIEYVWFKANNMVGSVRAGGRIYDTTSIKNSSGYEKIIAEKFQVGVHIKRIVCCGNLQKSLSDFISLPKDNLSDISGTTFSIHHLPYSLPLDILITQQGNSINAIIGFRSSPADTGEYSSAFFVLNDEFANEILSIFKNVLLPETFSPQEKTNKDHNEQCNICKEIYKMKTGG